MPLRLGDAERRDGQGAGEVKTNTYLLLSVVPCRGRLSVAPRPPPSVPARPPRHPTWRSWRRRRRVRGRYDAHQPHPPPTPPLILACPAMLRQPCSHSPPMSKQPRTVQHRTPCDAGSWRGRGRRTALRFLPPGIRCLGSCFGCWPAAPPVGANHVFAKATKSTVPAIAGVAFAPSVARPAAITAAPIRAPLDEGVGRAALRPPAPSAAATATLPPSPPVVPLPPLPALPLPRASPPRPLQPAKRAAATHNGRLVGAAVAAAARRPPTRTGPQRLRARYGSGQAAHHRPRQ